MYAKVFSQIFDSSIADDFRLRHFFMDMLVLADQNGVVDMTPTAISARTRIPLEDVRTMLNSLEQPDAESRTPDHDGRRIAKLDTHRTWGWCIINYDRFRKTASEDQRREKTRERVARFKAKHQQNTHGNASLTHGNASNAMQKQKQKQKEPPTPGPSAPLTTPQRITLEGKLRLQKERVEKLRHLCSDRLEVQENPGLIAERKEAEAFLTNLENQLLKS